MPRGIATGANDLLHKPYLYIMQFQVQNAAEFIPQKNPFVLVDKLVYVDENTSHGSFKIPKENIFVKSGHYSTSGMVESMAQTAAAGTGYLFRRKQP